MAKAPATPKITTAEPDWALPKVNEAGQQVDENGLPLGKLARAMALAEAGSTEDPDGIVSADDIAAHNPKALQADREAIDAALAEQAETETAAADADATTKGD